MLGWLEELNGDYQNAEKYYCYALQLEPIDPLHFLRLIQLVTDTAKYVQALLTTSENIANAKKKDLKKKIKEGKIRKNTVVNHDESNSRYSYQLTHSLTATMRMQRLQRSCWQRTCHQ